MGWREDRRDYGHMEKGIGDWEENRTRRSEKEKKRKRETDTKNIVNGVL